MALDYVRARKLWFRATNRADRLRTLSTEATRTVEFNQRFATPEQIARAKVLAKLADKHLTHAMRLWTVQRLLRPPEETKPKKRAKARV